MSLDGGDIKIERLSNGVLYGDIKPDFIYNRFDLWDDSGEYEVIRVKYNHRQYTFEVRYDNREAQMGLWLMDLPSEVVEAAAKQIFAWHSDIKKIYYTHNTHKAGLVKTGKHYRVDLPDSMDEFDKKSSGKTRSSMRRKMRLLEKDTGEEISYQEYSVQDGIPVQVMRDYFRLKNETFPQYTDEYIEGLNDDEIRAYAGSCHITHIYVMRIGEVMAGTVLSGEQCENVHFDNITYNTKYKKYSPGIIIYDYYLKRLLEKGKVSVFLGGGEWEYKKRYSAVEDVVYEGRFYRSELHKIFARFKTMLHRRRN